MESGMILKELFCILLVFAFMQNPANADLPNDPLLSQQWYLSKINLPKVWSMQLKTSEVIVAIIDTGVDLEHEDLRDNLWVNNLEIPDNKIDDDNNGFVDDINGWDFQGNDNIPMDEDQSNTGHGTTAAGVIGAVTQNSLGISGIGTSIKLMVIRAFDTAGISSDQIIANAIDYAVANGAQVINASFGGYRSADAELMIKAVERAQKKDVVFVAAAGNYGGQNDIKEFLPGNLRLDNVISVAASTLDDTKWIGSNYGSNNVDISAPGVNIFTTKLGNTYGAVTATSIATPVVAGVAALIKSVAPSLTSKSIKTIILNTGSPVSIETVCKCRVDAFEAIKYAMNL